MYALQVQLLRIAPEGTVMQSAARRRRLCIDTPNAKPPRYRVSQTMRQSFLFSLLPAAPLPGNVAVLLRFEYPWTGRVGLTVGAH
jgi:hypothetical protein